MVCGGNGCIIIKTEAPAMIAVYDMMGSVIRQLEAEGYIQVGDLNRGIYIVRINDRSHKVLVK
jgi:hypothetical protein